MLRKKILTLKSITKSIEIFDQPKGLNFKLGHNRLS